MRCLMIHLRLGVSMRLMSGEPAQRTSMSYTRDIESEPLLRVATSTVFTPMICTTITHTHTIRNTLEARGEPNGGSYLDDVAANQLAEDKHIKTVEVCY